MKKIEVYTRKMDIFLIDESDFGAVSQYTWYITASGYLMRTSISDDGCRWLLHRFIMDVLYAPEIYIDHIDGNPRNNTRANLRKCTRMENNLNVRKKSVPTSSRYKGVSWHKQKQKWSSKITYLGKQFYLGDYTSEIEAAEKYNTMATRLHGEFASLNIFGVIDE